MDKQTYRDLLPLVNDKGVMQLSKKYARALIEVLRDQLEQTIHPDWFKSIQGSIAELRRLLRPVKKWSKEQNNGVTYFLRIDIQTKDQCAFHVRLTH